MRLERVEHRGGDHADALVAGSQHRCAAAAAKLGGRALAVGVDVRDRDAMAAATD